MNDLTPTGVPSSTQGRGRTPEVVAVVEEGQSVEAPQPGREVLRARPGLRRVLHRLHLPPELCPQRVDLPHDDVGRHGAVDPVRHLEAHAPQGHVPQDPVFVLFALGLPQAGLLFEQVYEEQGVRPAPR